MSDRTKIEWTRGDDGSLGATWNPVTGCTKLSPASPGCEHCYASTLSERFRGTPGHYYERGFDVQLRPEQLIHPMRWRRPRRIFVNSMSDLFHDQVPDDYIAQVFAVMQSSAAHTFQVLTKRHGRMRSLLSSTEFWDAVTDFGGHLLSQKPSRQQYWPDHGRRHGFLPNVWLGVTAENQHWFTIRGDALRATPAAVRFMSLEPLLGPIDGTDLSGIDWIIVGGESGRGARPMHPDWARLLRDRCVSAGVPFLFKQWGEWLGVLGAEHDLWEPHAYVNALTGEVSDENSAVASGGDWTGVFRVGKKASGRVLDGRTWDQFPADDACAAVRVANRVVAALGERVYRAARERELQDGIETVLREHDFRVEREFRLSDRDRPDFLIDGSVAVEVKMRASGAAVLSQLARYASDRRVEAIVVATPRLSSLAGMPSEILGVPVRMVALPGPGLAL